MNPFRLVEDQHWYHQIRSSNRETR